MNLPPWSSRFFASTRGRIITLLRRTGQTVNDLAAALGLTDNAVRVHLATLERDGLVRQGAARPSLRKPQSAYELTPDAELLFPKAYDAVLTHLLTVLHEQHPGADTEAMIREVGRRIAAAYLPNAHASDFATRLNLVLAIFQQLGGLAELESHDDGIHIRGHRCPLAAVSAQHPAICCLAETLVAEILQTPVREHCVHGEVPQCNLTVAHPA